MENNRCRYMKDIVVCLFLASLCSFGMTAVAEKNHNPGSEAYGESLSRLILNTKDVISGYVFQSPQGISISTQEGTFILKGTPGEDWLGRNVRVSGIIRGKSIFAMSVQAES